MTLNPSFSTIARKLVRSFVAGVVTCFVLSLVDAGNVARAQLPYTWNNVAPPSLPSGRYYHAMAFDNSRNQAVMFGGFDGARKADTWIWTNREWTNMPVVGPSGRIKHAMVYVPSTQKIILFGGSLVDGSNSNETWEFDGIEWRKLTPAQSPPARNLVGMSYDSVRDRVVLFGGFQGGTKPNLSDTWEWDGVNWIQLAPATSPPPRNGHAMAFDTRSGRTIMFGGYDSDRRGDTWMWDGSEWTEHSGSPSPSARNLHSMSVDPVNERVILFGGLEGNSTYSSSTWEWKDGAWSELTPQQSPEARCAHTTIFDASLGQVLLYGGNGGVGAVQFLGQNFAFGPPDLSTPTPTFTPGGQSGGSATPTPTTTPSRTPTPTRTPVSTLTATPTSTPTFTATRTQTPTASPTGTEAGPITETPTPTVTATLTSTATSTPTITVTSTLSPTHTPSPTNTVVATPTEPQVPAITPTTSATATSTTNPAFSSSPTPTGTLPLAPTETATSSGTQVTQETFLTPTSTPIPSQNAGSPTPPFATGTPALQPTSNPTSVAATPPSLPEAPTSVPADIERPSIDASNPVSRVGSVIVSGFVRSSGSPIGGVYVSAGEFGAAVTNRSGEFAVRVPKGAKYSLSFSKFGMKLDPSVFNSTASTDEILKILAHGGTALPSGCKARDTTNDKFRRHNSVVTIVRLLPNNRPVIRAGQRLIQLIEQQPEVFLTCPTRCISANLSGANKKVRSLTTQVATAVAKTLKVSKLWMSREERSNLALARRDLLRLTSRLPANTSICRV